jgi:hypothetical protein
MMLAALASFLGHWAVIGASCATGFAVSEDRITFYMPMGFEDKELPPEVFAAETTQDRSSFSIVYTGRDGKTRTMRFTVSGERLIDSYGYWYRRCKADGAAVS